MTSAYYKEEMLAVLTAALGLLALWVGVKQGLLSPSALGLILAFAVSYALGALLIRSPYGRWAGFGIPFAFSLYFLPLNQWTYAWVFASFICATLGWWEISKQRDFTFLFGVRRILRSGLPSLFTGMAILAALFYYTTIGTQKENMAILPRSVFDISFPYIAKGLTGVIPAGISLDKDKTVDVFYDLIGRKSAELTKPYEAYMPLVYTLGVFLAVKGILFPIYWLTLLIASLLFVLGRKIGIIKESASSIPTTNYFL